MNLISKFFGMTVISMAACAAMADAPVTTSMNDRVDRLERMMGSQGSYQVQNDIQQIREDIQTLRGMLEVQQHELQKIKARLDALSSVSAKGPAATPVPAQAPASTALPSEAETNLYKAAYEMLTEQKYSAAIPALKNYIQSYPNGQYVASAYYWLGETQTIANDLEDAKKAFQTVIDKYPASPKAPDATLKLGMVYEDAGQYDKALLLFNQVSTKFPNTPQARLAQDRITQINNINR